MFQSTTDLRGYGSLVLRFELADLGTDNLQALILTSAGVRLRSHARKTRPPIPIYIRNLYSPCSDAGRTLYWTSGPSIEREWTEG